MLSKTTRYTRHTYGDNGVFGKRNIVSTSFGSVDLGKAGDAVGDAYLDGVSEGTHEPDEQPSVPRNVTVVGVTDDTGDVVVTGTNNEGATITETIALDSDTEVEGDKAFASITSIDTPDATVDVGYGNKFGIGQRTASTSSIKVLVIDGSSSSIEDADSSSLDDEIVEENTVTPTTTPDGDKQLRVYVLNYNWHVDPTNSNPDYGV